MNGWIVLLLGVFIEALNFSWARTWLTKRKPSSAVLIVPLVFTMGGVWLLGDQYDRPLLKWIGLAVMFSIHVIVAFVIPYAGGGYRYGPQAREEVFKARGIHLKD